MEASAAPRPQVAEQDAFEQFFLATWPALHAFAGTLCGGDRAAAEEIAQEALARVYVRFGGLDDPRPYAFKVASNLVRRRWQDEQRVRPVDPLLLADPRDAGGTDHTLDAVRRLPGHLREVVLLHYYADLPLAIVARLLRRPLGTIKRRLYDARAVLAVTLGEDSS